MLGVREYSLSQISKVQSINNEQLTMNDEYAKRLSEGVLKDTPADIPFRDPLGQKAQDYLT